ncbi:MAG: peptidylprolyl isomerase [Prevotellaceae bacterium]|jgi:cyclophilin family peptidyl-prolyl cis-trans isomerase|nr:peptidylprolyl isomerase [Prevotellaceae bacterium]
MKTKKIALAIFLTTAVSAITFCQTTNSKPVEKTVLIETSLGSIKVKLYNETPQHRDNFLKLAGEGFYDSLIFHRVISSFMVQAGDPTSRNPQPDQRYGSGETGYTIPAEINPAQLFHKKGALAAARKGDQVNPEKQSSGSQFYIVQGKVSSDEELTQMELNISQKPLQGMFNQMLSEALQALQAQGAKVNQDSVVEDVRRKVLAQWENMEKFSYTPEQREAYKTVGGTPFLDGGYTVFGEVVEGLDVVDKIAAVETNAADRPTQDVFIVKMTVQN